MQVAHPLIAAGVAQHSTFRESAVAPLARLHGTVKAMLGLTFGSAEEQTRVINGIRSIHTRVHGTLGEPVGRYAAGTPYSAEDPALLLWVHATLIMTTIRVYELIVADLADRDRDDYCLQSAEIALALGADPAAVPRDWATILRYVQAMLADDTLAVGRDAHALADAILNSRTMRWSGPAGWAARRLTIGLLPTELRHQYGATWDARQQVRFMRLVGVLKHTRRWMPPSLAQWRGARVSSHT
jgi:uncharacterized protein (DUF2236 family)